MTTDKDIKENAIAINELSKEVGDIAARLKTVSLDNDIQCSRIGNTGDIITTISRRLDEVEVAARRGLDAGIQIKNISEQLAHLETKFNVKVENNTDVPDLRTRLVNVEGKIALIKEVIDKLEDSTKGTKTDIQTLQNNLTTNGTLNVTGGDAKVCIDGVCITKADLSNFKVSTASIAQLQQNLSEELVTYCIARVADASTTPGLLSIKKLRKLLRRKRDLNAFEVTVRSLDDDDDRFIEILEAGTGAGSGTGTGTSTGSGTSACTSGGSGTGAGSGTGTSTGSGTSAGAGSGTGTSTGSGVSI
eukprot:gene1110-biopygen2495